MSAALHTGCRAAAPRDRVAILMPLGVLLTLSAGCGIEPDTLATIQEVVQSAAVEKAMIETPEPALVTETAFEPPYADRIDPFTFPSGATLAAEQPGTSITSAAQIDVVGFADVDGQHVFLRTRDKVRLLAVGESTGGVEVVGIHPPAVELRMGSLQWRATMFDASKTGGN